MSDERNLISKILQEGAIADVVDAGITDKFFVNQEHRAAYRWIMHHQATYSKMPSIEAFQKNFPAESYRLSKPQDPLKYYIDQSIEMYQDYLLSTGLTEAIDLFDNGDSEGTRSVFANTLKQLNVDMSGAKVTDLTLTGKKRLERYDAYSKNDGALKGIPSGFESVDEATGGFQPGQLFTFVGPPKAGKSTMMLLSDMAAHRGFYRPLFIGFEMSNEEQEERHDAIRAQVSHTSLRAGKLTRDEFNALEKMTRRLELMPPLIFSEDANSTLTLSGVASQIEKTKPNIVFVDGVYMMEDENGEKKGSPQAITNLTRGFKQLAKNMGLPVVISSQVLLWKMDRKRGVTASSVGYSSSFAQDSDGLFAVENTEDKKVKKVKVLLARNHPGKETFVMWDWDTAKFLEMDEYIPEENDGKSSGY